MTPPSVGMEIRLLADAPDAIPVLAEWFHAEWHCYDGRCIAEIEAQAEVRVLRLIIAVDAGRVINPDGAAHQIEGGAIQATSWTLKEAVRFDRTRVTSDRWDNYPILRFSEVPQVQVEIVPRSDCASVGVGEAAQGPTAAAIANALFDALGIRVRDLPLSSDRVRAAISAATI